MGKNERLTFSFTNEKLQNQMARAGTNSISVEGPGCTARYTHRPSDGRHVNRVQITTGELEIELLPSKGLTVERITLNGMALLWEPLLSSLPHPGGLDLHGDLMVQGHLTKGFRLLEHLTGGIMMFGVTNWGMPWTDPDTGKFFPIHGDVSNIPVDEVVVEMNPERIEVRGDFDARDGQGDQSLSWYDRGEILYSVTKRVIVEKTGSRITINDTIMNKTNKDMRPDWGYTIKLRAETGARYLVPSRSVENRFAGPLPRNHEAWTPTGLDDERIREERGIIHKGLSSLADSPSEPPDVETLVRYPAGNGILVVVPKTPYFLSWYSAGGKGSTEFRLPPDEGGNPLDVTQVGWDGLGPEFGSSALDHDGNIDPEVPAPNLGPGQSLDISFSLEPVSTPEAEGIEKRIASINRTRSEK